jgi:hypothetical protein
MGSSVPAEANARRRCGSDEAEYCESDSDIVYETVHRYFLQSRRKWFEGPAGKQVVLWWVAAGQIPTLEEAKAKLRLLDERGPSAIAFTVQDASDPPGRPLSRAAGPGDANEPQGPTPAMTS